jgi:lipid A ethanolaminephosphotransferase
VELFRKLRLAFTNTRAAYQRSDHASWTPLPAISPEVLMLLTSLFFSLFCNRLLWSEVFFANRDWTEGSTWFFAAAFFVAITSVHFLALCLIPARVLIKPILSIILVFTAPAVYYMNRFTVFFDTNMVRNVLRTDVKETADLLSGSLLWYIVFYAVIPITIIWVIPLQRRTWKRAVAVRFAYVSATVILTMLTTLIVFKDISALIRNKREVRYLVTPSNFLVSAARVLIADTESAAKPKIPISEDAKLRSADPSAKPILFVMVLGETARAANWGLNGYERQTTPELAKLDVMNFSDVTSCGTSTEVSVPCMFSPFGRGHYNEAKIRGHESLLHILNHVGIRTLWRDNQSGCKGVCDGLEQQRLDSAPDSRWCAQDRCLDEILLEGLDSEIAKSPGNMFVVLHQLGNHGPAYFRRYPKQFRQFKPTCDTAELGSCSREEVTNSYDNALLYTDHFLAKTIGLLKEQTSHETVMLYVSDHGESLGEHGIYLHGMPYSIAPKVQKEVPMVIWASPDFKQSHAKQVACIASHASSPLSHDNLFSSVLGLFGVESSYYTKTLDLSASCH